MRLEDVADVKIEPIPNVIYHDSLFRSIDVGANIDGTRDLGSIVSATSRLGSTTTSGRPSTTRSSSASTPSGELPRTA